MPSEGIRDLVTKAGATTASLPVEGRAVVYELNLVTGTVIRSEGIEEMLGYAEGSLPIDNNGWRSLIHPEDVERADRDYIEARQGSGTYAIEYRVRRKDGTYAHVLDRGMIVFGPERRVERLIGATIDLSRQREAEQALKESEARERARAAELEAILSAVPAAVFIAHDPECKRITGSDAAYEMLRVGRPNELSASADEDVRPPFIVKKDGVTIDPRMLPMQIAAREGVTVGLDDFEIHFPDHPVRYLSGSAVPLLNEEGQVAGSVGFFVDLSERVRAQRAAEESESRLQIAMEAAQMGTWRLNALTREFTIDANLNRIRGNEAVSTTISLEQFLEPVDPQDRSILLARIERSLQRHTPFQCEYQIRTTDGQMRSMRSRGRVVFDNDGVLTALTGVAMDITEHRSAEAALLESEERFRLIAEHAQDLICMIDAEGRFTYVSPSYEPALGYRVSDLQGRRFVDYVHPEDRESVPDWSQFDNVEIRLVKANGEPIWLEARSFTVPWEGKPYTVGIARDISERRRLWNEIWERERLLRIALEGAYAMAWDGHVPTTSVTCEQVARLFALPVNASEGGMPNEDLARVDEALREAVAPGAVIDVEFRWCDAKGRCRWYNVRGRVGVGEESDQMSGITIDITDRKEAEQAFFESEERFRKLVETSPYGLMLAAPAGTVDFANPALLQMLGYRKEQVCGTKTWQQLTAPGYEEADARATHLLKTEGVCPPYEKEYLSADGEPIPVLVSGAVLDTAERVPTIAGFVMDLRPLKKAEESLRKLNQDLEQRVLERTAALEAANRELEGFTYSVSHDLRTPLRAVMSTSMILMEDFADQVPEEAKEALQRQAAAARKLGTLIDDLLKLSRIGRADLTRSRFDLAEMAAELVEEVAGGERRVGLTVPATLETSGDPKLVRLALQNLLENSIKFADSERPLLIEIGRVDAEGEEIFFVRDNGIGFDMAYAPKIFLPFERLHRDSEYPGTGIGLANVRRIIERHGGRVWAESAPNEGATFYFTLEPAASPSTSRVSLI